MKVKVFKNYEELSKEAAKEIISQVNEKPNSILGLATGSSPLGIYKEMVYDFNLHHTSYKQVKTFNLDEYFGIKQDQEQSYFRFMKDHLFDHIDIDVQNVNIPRGDVSDIKDECHDYNLKLADHVIDIQVLGIGSNGHIGFNEPGTSFESVTHQVKLDEKTRKDNARFFDSIEEVPTHAISMGIKNILNAKKIVLIASGKNKAQAIKGMIKGPVDPNCPASALQMHDDVVVYLDEEAASEL